MDLIEINDIIGGLTADLSLYKSSMGDISLTILRNYSSVLKENRLDFERETRNCVKDPATETYMRELYYSLIEYSGWYSDHHTEVASNDVVQEAKVIFELIEVMWRPLIEDLFPKFRNDDGNNPSPSKDDPEGYNQKFGKPGERYRSIRYDLTENPDYPHLTKKVVFDRLQTMVGEMPSDGADISRLISLAYKHGLLVRIPNRKSIMRELGVKSSEQSLTEFIDNREDAISDSKRLRPMEQRLLEKQS